MIRNKNGRLEHFEETDGSFKAEVEFYEEGILILTLKDLDRQESHRYVYVKLKAS